MRELPMGTRLMDSTPQAITMSCVPDMMACTAKCTACWLEPHLRSMVVDGTWAGRPAANQARRPGVPACSPAWLTQPVITSSTASRSEEHTSELQSLAYLVCRLLLEKK